MFANEDFDLDEDFLNDVTQKESQVFSSDDESSTKRFKKDENSSQQSCNKSDLNVEKLVHLKSKKDFLVPNTHEIGGKKTIRKNLILERLKRNENTSSDPSIHQCAAKIDSQSSNVEKSSSVQALFSHPTHNESRKTLIMEAFRKNNAKSISTCSRDSEEKSCPINVDNVTPNTSKLEHCETIGKSHLKPTKTYNKPLTLVREFPGPAGLLPHLSGGIIPPLVPESSCFDDSNDATDTDVIENTSILAKYCSQDTTNSFSEGAWQLLISDLSLDFLSGHEISTVKQKVLSNLYKNNKVPFLAGIIQRVDFSRLDPLVVLKDYTGIIEGTICKDILLEYPHSLDIGVVLFLGNVGLLTIGSYLKKCHVIITLKNIINMYTGKSKIFSISEMNARLKNLSNCNQKSYESVVTRVLNSSCSSNSKSECGSNMETIKVAENTNLRLCPSNLKNPGNLSSSSNYSSKPTVSKEFSVITNKHINSEASKSSTHKSPDLFQNNHKNLASFQTDTNSSQCSTNHINKKSTFESGDLQDFDDDFAASFLDIDDDLVFESATNIDPLTNSGIKTDTSVSTNDGTFVFNKDTILNSTQLNAKLSQETEHFVSKGSNVCSESTQESEATGRKITAISAAKEKSNLSRTSDIKLKLSVFRSKTELTQQPCKGLDIESQKENHKQNNQRVQSSLTSNFLLNGENDSDEELFSQLDVESIVSNYNRLNDVN